MKLIPSSLLSFNKNKQTWQWRPSCKNPKTLSFRAHDTMFKTVNSVFFDPKYSQTEAEVEVTTPDTCFTNSSESASMSTESEPYLNTNECKFKCSSVEAIVREARSDRLIFEPGPTSSSILESNKDMAGDGVAGAGAGDGCSAVPYKESVVVAIESEDPHGDFKQSMEEMVESHGLKDWECLEELLGWYLKMNGKNNHEFIIQAFVDLLAGINGGGGAGAGHGGSDGGGASCSDQSLASFTSAASTFSSPICSPLYEVGGVKEIIEEEKMVIDY